MLSWCWQLLHNTASQCWDCTFVASMIWLGVLIFYKLLERPCRVIRCRESCAIICSFWKARSRWCGRGVDVIRKFYYSVRCSQCFTHKNAAFCVLRKSRSSAHAFFAKCEVMYAATDAAYPVMKLSVDMTEGSIVISHLKACYCTLFSICLGINSVIIHRWDFVNSKSEKHFFVLMWRYKYTFCNEDLKVCCVSFLCYLSFTKCPNSLIIYGVTDVWRGVCVINCHSLSHLLYLFVFLFFSILNILPHANKQKS